MTGRMSASLGALLLMLGPGGPALGQGGAAEPASGTPGTSEAPGKSKVYERDVVDVDPAQPVTLLQVDNRLGDVRIEGHDGKSVIISAFKRAGDQDTLDRLKVSLVPDPSGPVRVSTSIGAGGPGNETRPIPKGSIGIDVVIRAPRSARIEAQVWNGRLSVIGMENGAELTANDGDIDVKNVSGTIITRSAAGKQQFVEVFGAVEAQAVSGNMDMDVVRGQRLDASVHEGRIDSRKVRVREAWLRAVKGDIRFHGQALAGGRYFFGTYRGNVEVQLAQGALVSIRARSRQGRVTLPAGLVAHEDARGGVVATLPGEGQTPAVFELSSRMGNIQFVVVE